MISNNKKKIDLDIFFYVLIFWTFFLTIVGIFLGGNVGDDYLDYTVNWERALIEKEPWQEYSALGQKNVYGPFHNFMAIFYYFSPTLPKIIYIFIFIFSNYILYKHLNNSNFFEKLKNKLIYLLILPFNFVFITDVFLFGHNDALVTGFVIFSLILKINKNIFFSGVFLALSFFEKFYTIFLFPFFFIDFFHTKKFNELKLFLYGSIITGIFVMLITFFWFGFDLDFLKAIDGQMKITGMFSYTSSLLWFIEYFPNRLGFLSEVFYKFLDINTFLIFLFYSIFVIFSLKYKINFYINLILGFWIALTIYKLSFMTYYMLLFNLFLFLPLDKTIKYPEILMKLVLPFIIFTSITSFLYFFVTDAFGTIYPHFRNFLGFINIFLSFFCMSFLLIAYFHRGSKN